MTVVNSVIIRPPVSMRDVCQVLGNSSTDLATLCVAGQINKWARYKPVRHSAIGVITEAQRKSVNYGINNIPVWTGNGAVNKMGNFWFGVDTSSSNYPQCGLQTTYWSYLRPAGGLNSPYRLADFVKEAGSTYGYKHDVVAPIGGCTQSTIIISATGYLTIPFSGNGSGQSDGYTVPLSELSGVGVATGDFGNMYMSVMIRNISNNIYYVASRDDKWSIDNSTTVSRSIPSAAVGNALVGSCQVFPFLSTEKFDSYTNNLSGETGPVVAMFEKSAVTLAIQYAEANPSDFAAYYTNESDHYLNYSFSLTNNSGVAFRVSYTISFSPQSTFPSSDTVQATGNIYITSGSTESISGSITLPSQTAAHYINGYAKVEVTAQAGYGIMFYRSTSTSARITNGLPR